MAQLDHAALPKSREPWEGFGFLPEFEAIAASEPDRLFATCLTENGETPVTFATLAKRSSAFAAYCQGAGCGEGSKIAVMMDSCPDYFALMFGIAMIGAVWVPINTKLKGESLEFILASSAPKLLVADAGLLDVIGNAVPAGVRVIAAGGVGAENLDDILARSARVESVSVAPDAVFAISYTSGTTGRPKGVPVTHAMLRYAGEAAALVADLADGDILLMWEPLHHIGGAQLLVLPLVRRVHMAMVPRFSASRFWDQVRATQATHIHYLGGILQMLLKQPPSDLDKQHNVRIAWGGGCVPEAWRPFEERFGVRIQECYGMTESSSLTTINVEGIVGSVGRPLPWFDVDLVDPETSIPVKRGEKGEIVVTPKSDGPLFSGYIDEPVATAKALRNGSLHTGDLGEFDSAGRLFFHGRATDSVRVKGENVAAWDVERASNAHPAVAVSAMIGVKADVGEKDIKLFVQLKPEVSLSAADLDTWLSERLAPFQMPRYIAFVDNFERTASERIMKHKLDSSIENCWSSNRR